MQIAEFETEIVDDTIHIPEDLKGSLPREVRVVLTDGAPYNPRITMAKEKIPADFDGFFNTEIDVSNFKFDREEANER